MNNSKADHFFDTVNFVSIVDTIKNIYSSDGSMSVLLDFERVLDDADVYAFRNWQLGELVQGPNLKRYSVVCVFMWPYKLMPDPRAAKRLTILGCKVHYLETKIEVPVEVTNYEDFVPGTNYPKMAKRKVWLVRIEIPTELMNDIKEGYIDLADQKIDLDELEKAYNEDLDKADLKDTEGPAAAQPEGPAMGPPGMGPQGMGVPQLGL